MLFYTIYSIMADEVTLQNSLQSQENIFDFQNRQFTYVPDQNNGSYPSGQIVFDLASFANSGKYVDWSQSLLVIPLVLNLNAASGSFGNGLDSAFAASLKNGAHQLINSLSVELTNNSVVNLTSFSNLDINYKLLTSMSADDQLNFGKTLLFSKDTAESVFYQGLNTSALGAGECNNNIKQSTFTTTNGWGATAIDSNAGRLDRMFYTSFDLSSSLVPSKYTNASLCNTNLKNYVTYSASNITYYITATIPLRILHDIFKKLPLIKGSYMRLIINTNTACTCNLTLTTSTGVITAMTVASQNGVLPFQITPCASNSGQGWNASSCTSLSATLGIAKCYNTSLTAVANHSLSQARVYGCMYDMSPIIEQKYLSLMPSKKVVYNDILSFQVMNTAAGSNFSQILTNGISRARYLLICPQHSASTHGASTAAASTYSSTIVVPTGTGPMNSPFSSSPGTCLPYSSITNFNVLESGVNHYQSNLTFRWENWLEEVRQSNSLQGGLQLGLSSGLLSQSDYENGYGFIYVDLSRKQSQASDDVARSIQIVGTNSSLVAMDLYCIIGYEREITISTATGSLII